MKISKLKVSRFRNLTGSEIKPNERLNILFGPNGSGKTNLCESIHFVSTGDNLKGNRQQELIHWNSDDALIKVNLSTNDQIIVYLKRGEQKQVRYNSNPKTQSKLRNFFATYTFIPEDLYLSKGAPQRRRTMINDQLTLLDEDYTQTLTKYNDELKKKNNLLKKDEINAEFLMVLNDRLSELGAEIIVSRIRYLKRLNNILPQTYREFSSTNHKLTLNYSDQRYSNKTREEIEAILGEELEEKYEKEREVETTIVGPHRDKFVFKLQGRSLRKYGSQGEQRTAVIATYFSNIRLYKENEGDWPILIFDDILSELDTNRGDALLNNLPTGPQIFMTTATRNPAFKKLSGEFSVFQLSEGKIKEK